MQIHLENHLHGKTLHLKADRCAEIYSRSLWFGCIFQIVASIERIGLLVWRLFIVRDFDAMPLFSDDSAQLGWFSFP